MESIVKETYWSQFAEDYESKQSFVSGIELIDLVKNELVKEKKLGKVLELGCGTGLFTETLKDKAEHIIATDFSDEMIEMAIKLRGGFSNVQFVKADAMNLEFEEERFDTVFMSNLIHIIRDPKKVLKESMRVLKKNGLILITSFAIDEMSFINKFKLVIRFLKTFGKVSQDATKVKTAKHDIEKMMSECSFEIIKSKVLGDKSKSYYIIGCKN